MYCMRNTTKCSEGWGVVLELEVVGVKFLPGTESRAVAFEQTSTVRVDFESQHVWHQLL